MTVRKAMPLGATLRWMVGADPTPEQNPEQGEGGKVIPLTHHDILKLVAPFSRDGRRVDLAATDRQARTLVFQPIEHDSVGLAGLTLTETLTLENPKADQFRLVRTLTHASGLKARLEVEGPTVEGVYRQLTKVAPAQQFMRVDSVLAALDYRVRRVARRRLQGGEIWPMRFAGGEAVVAGRRLTLDARQVEGLPAKLVLEKPSAGEVALPADLLAVRGRAWRPLQATDSGWKSTIKLAHREPERSEDAENKFAQTISHLVAIFSRPPEDFHARFLRRRWQVVFRRSLPVQGVLGILALVPVLYLLGLGREEPLPLWTTGIPPVLLLAVFWSWSREVPVLEIPPPPRPLDLPAWTRDTDA
ncbi:hypothetical protein [Ectothiorhodospira sp. PHS-1]|uniref:hypothetical protein n=1 Tax=Ectothiorhodospira sp. PHS-1 TaxID=519989 RepID=UPI001145E467|nr:hypothetical protein [Ectothiorhodospira sp. PHS-1]